MSREHTNIEEENLKALLGAALGRPQAARTAVTRPPILQRRRLLKRLLAAAAVVGIASVAFWLVTSRGAPALPFAEVLAESLRRIEQVETMVSTVKIIEEGNEKVWRHSYYKSPRFHRDEQGGMIVFDDEKRFILLDPDNEKVVLFGPSEFARHPERKKATDLMTLEVWKGRMPRLGYQFTGPFSDELDGVSCQRYDYKIKRPPNVPTEASAPKATLSYWFAVESGLMVRELFRSETSTTREDFQYNVPLDDSLFAIPEWAKPQIPKPLRIRVIARDEKGKALPGAKVYISGRGRQGYQKLITDAEGEAVLTLDIFARRHWETEQWYFLLRHPDVIVESTDGNQAALYTFGDILLIIGQGLRKIIYEDPVKNIGKPIGEEDFSEPRPDIQVDYEPADNMVILAMKLAQKATVTGRVVDTAGRSITDVPVVIRPSYRVQEGPFDYGKLDVQIPPEGKLPLRERYFNVKADGSFELELPTNYPLTLTFQPQDRTYSRTATEELTLQPGAEISLGNIVLPPGKPEKSK